MAESPLKSLKKGKQYEIYTKVKEIPVKTILKLSWIDYSSKLVGFDWGNCIRKGAFQPGGEVYVKLSEGNFIKGRVVSNRQELVLEPEEKCSTPEFLKRRAVRVEVDPSNPVKVRISIMGKHYDTQARDISEYGVGIILKKEDKKGKEILSFLESHRGDWVDLDLELPKYGKIHAKGRVRRKEYHGGEVYIRFGFEVEFSEDHRTKVRKYIMERQQEIIKSLRLL